MAKKARTRKAATIHNAPPAFIDPPGPFGTLQEWIEFRDSLQRSGIPHIAPFIREANREIARLRKRSLNAPAV